jgi:hypothetical protein
MRRALFVAVLALYLLLEDLVTLLLAALLVACAWIWLDRLLGLLR